MLNEVAEQVVLFGSAAEGIDAVDSGVDLFIRIRLEAVIREILNMFIRKHSYRGLSPQYNERGQLREVKKAGPVVVREYLPR